MLGRAHEKGNYLQYKKHLLEDSILPDSVSSVMDLRNNEIGANWAVGTKIDSRKGLLKMIVENVEKLRVIKKDAQGNFLTCDDVIIPIKEWLGKWNIPKCLDGTFNH